jgi:hypothetical protein
MFMEFALFGRLGRFATWWVICLLCVGCVSQRRQPPFEIHSAQAVTSHYFGTPLSGPVSGDVSRIDFSHALDVRVQWFALERFHCDRLPFLASQARLITSKLAGQAVLPTAVLTRNVRITWPGAVEPEQYLLAVNPSRLFEIGGGRGLTVTGLTASFRAVETGGAGDATLGRSEPRYIEVGVTQTAPGSVQIALAVQDADSSATRPDGAAEFPIFQRESAIVDHAFGSDPLSVLLIVPFSWSGPPNQAVAAWVTISTPKQDADFKRAVADCREDLASKGSESTVPLWTLGLSRAMNELDDPARRRAALVYLAGQGDAEICQDVVMVADDALLEQISRAVKAQAPAAIDDANEAQYAWILNRSAVEAMQPLLTAGTLPDDLFAVLTLHFGETGRHAAAVDDVMHGATSQRDLQDRLISENFIYLQDSAPSARVRAFEWLKARDIAPKGFDPLASPRQRRLALDAALSADVTTGPAGGAP